MNSIAPSQNHFLEKEIWLIERQCSRSFSTVSEFFGAKLRNAVTRAAKSTR